jgi:hypothetical protein
MMAMASEVQKDEEALITWEIFKQELVTRFDPTDYEIFDKALACITQQGSLRDYQREFERLANREVGWPQNALVGTFLGGLKEDIAAPSTHVQTVFKPSKP